MSRSQIEAIAAWKLSLAIAMTGFCGTYLGTIFTQDAERVSSIWAVNGVVLGLVLLMPRRSWAALITALAMSFVVANLLLGDDIQQAIGLASANTLEVLVGAVAMNRMFGKDRATTSRVWLLRLALLAGLAACTLSASVASFVLSNSANRFADVFATYFPAHLIGVVTLTPIVVILLGARSSHATGNAGANLPAIVFAATGLTFALFAQHTIPLMFLAFPMLIFAAFRAGLAGTAAALFVFTCIATAMTVRGYGPLVLVHEDEQVQVLFLQFLVLVANLTVMPIAFALSDRTHAFAAQEALAEAAQKADAAKGQFLANMSHEIRTPLNGILGFSELLRESALGSRQARQIDLIHRSAASLLQLLNDILDFSKIEAGHMEVAKEPLDLKGRIADCVSLVEPMADAKNLRIAVSMDPNLPEAIESDNLRFRQILLNLLGNAIKFSDRGTISVRAQRNRDGRLALSVEDRGIGIASDRLESIFEEFVQADDTTARQFGGTGLGLSISKSLARLMGGDIALHSELGQGTTVCVTLPLVAVEAAPRLTAADPVRNGLQPARLLVVDDLEINREVIRGMLEGMGHQIVEAGNGREALEAINAAKRSGDGFAGVLMDVRMPVMDGLEATRQIKSDRSDRSLPVIGLTANSSPRDLGNCCEAGMDDVVIKPVTLQSLHGALSKILCQRDVIPPSKPRPGPSAALKEKYLSKKRASLVRIAQLMRMDALNGTTLEEIADIAHGLAGSAGMFGEAPFGDEAYDLETVIRDVIANSLFENSQERIQDAYQRTLAAA